MEQKTGWVQSKIFWWWRNGTCLLMMRYNTSCNQRWQTSILQIPNQTQIILHYSTSQQLSHSGWIESLWGKRWGLTKLLPLWRQMMSFAKWFLHVCITSCELLLQFPLFTTPNCSKVFETNTAGQKNVSERLLLDKIFTNSTNVLAGKGLKLSAEPFIGVQLSLHHAEASTAKG